MPTIKPKIKIEYLIYDRRDPRTLTKIARMLSTTDCTPRCRANGEVTIKHDYFGTEFSLFHGQVLYVVKTLNITEVAATDQKQFFDTFKKAIEKKETADWD